jgi:hypothetical protein
MREERYCLDHLDLDWDFRDVNEFDFCPKCGRRMIIQMQPEPEYDSNFKPVILTEVTEVLKKAYLSGFKKYLEQEEPPFLKLFKQGSG